MTLKAPLTKFLISQFTFTNIYNNIYNPNINLSKFEPLKPSRSVDISLLVFKISKEAVKQPCLDQKMQCLLSKYSYFLYMVLPVYIYFDIKFSGLSPTYQVKSGQIRVCLKIRSNSRTLFFIYG